MPGWLWGYVLAAVGVAGLWLAGSGRRVGWAVGVAGQVLWVGYAVATGQPGFLLSAGVYGATYARAWWRHRDRSDIENAGRDTGTSPASRTAPCGRAGSRSAVAGPAGGGRLPVRFSPRRRWTTWL
jgi:hypothetical protein